MEGGNMRVYRWAALTALCLVVGLFLILGLAGLDQARANGTEEQRLLELINEYREDNGAGTLVPSETLSTSAERHSKDMSAHDFFSHATKESSYYPEDSEPVDRLVQEGYPTNASTAENIAWGQPTAEEVFEDWRRSPEHDAAMLDEQYTTAGIGHAGTYWTADFGSVADTPSTLEAILEAREPDSETEAPNPEETPTLRIPAELSVKEQTSAPQPTDEQRAVKQESDEQTTGKQTTGEQTSMEQATGEQTQPEEPQPVTEPGEEDHTTVDIVQDGSRWTIDLGSEAQDLVVETETSTTEQPPTEPATPKQTSPPGTPQLANEQTTNLETRIEETTPVAEPGEEAMPRTTSSTPPSPGGPAVEQFATEESSTRESSSPRITPSSGEAPHQVSAEQSPVEQSSIPQSGTWQDAGERASDGLPRQADTPPVVDASEEATPQPTPVQLTAEGPAPEQRTAGEGGLAETLRPPDAELAVREPAAETTVQPVPTAPAEEGIQKASPVETEAMETALAARVDVPEGLVRPTPTAPDQPTEGIPATDRSPIAVTLGASSSGPAGNTQVATKELPRTSGALPLPLFAGGLLLLSGVLVYGAGRRQRGR